ncbi:DUF3000 domain-containing protein [Brevibacterium casei]|uniref:DUF3000 domain-containing protein n=1 Tax=Brevibacterium TaxID=1696 RepID=UPI000E65A83D|nr:DUF3000 domain-containing protein [Brevibacterium casei]MBE4696081.1 DUF3000 domain-containing protein [Brevibacterium casei]MBY3579203.1 DUF3000 domain-containing protein [Brevibacterium casei]MCT2359674.1 DUF3000 domain-containing protein [Brevibacterium casei]NJE68187.1 DUF3000 domain-containing protein [Brevibacterium sp. LS14]
MVNTSPLNRIPAEFSAVTSVLREARDTNNVSISEIPAPAKLAPYSYALGAEVTADENFITASGESIEELATGRIVVLFDPEAPEEWEGSFRIVSYIRAELEHELGNETMLGHVAWSWLEDALEANDCELVAAGGTTTRVLSESFGTLATRPATIDLELRASWTPIITEPEMIGDHLEAWIDLLCTVAGLPPLPEGVSALPGRRR